MRRRLPSPELAVAAAFVLLAASTTVALAARVVVRGDLMAGVDGPHSIDQFQYMAWARDAGEHLLISNRFDLVADPHVFLHPMWVVSGLLWQLGAGIQLAYLAWKPVAIVVLLAGFLAYVRRMLPPGGPRAAGLALALGYMSPVAPLLVWTGWASPFGRDAAELIAYELWPADDLWGLYHSAIALGAMAVFLLALERAAGAGGRRARVVAGAAGLTVSWLHPWQGLVLLAIVAGLVAWGRLGPRERALLLPAAFTAAPIAYYGALGLSDSAWEVVRHAPTLSHIPGWVALALAPLALPALAGIRRPGTDLQQRALLLWPVAALAVYFALQRSFIFHAVAGMSLPLAVLAVRGFARTGARVAPRARLAAGSAAIVLLTVPGTLFAVDDLRNAVQAGGTPYFLEPGEHDALRYIDRSPRSGGVLAQLYLGQAVPAHTGRNTWAGHPSWTPGFLARGRRADELYEGRLSREAALGLVRRVRPAFLLADCRGPDRVGSLVSPLIERTRRFGCAAVHELRPL